MAGWKELANFTKAGLRKIGVFARITLLAKKRWIGFLLTTTGAGLLAGAGAGFLAGAGAADAAVTNAKEHASVRRSVKVFFIGRVGSVASVGDWFR